MLWHALVLVPILLQYQTLKINGLARAIDGTVEEKAT